MDTATVKEFGPNPVCKNFTDRKIDCPSLFPTCSISVVDCSVPSEFNELKALL
jgi:hypothetical protein